MWHFISDHISQQVGETFICETARLIQQQHAHTCYVLKGATKRYFVKLRESAIDLAPSTLLSSPLQCEAEGLAAIQATNTIKTPQLICHGNVEENHKQIEYLVLQYICFKSPSENLWQRAGEQLAGLHQVKMDNHFGWRQDNWVGATQQSNAVDQDWARFFCQQRLQALLIKLVNNKVDIQLSDELLSNIQAFLSVHSPSHSLLHGDLWIGNMGFTRTSPIIFDPATFIGDREVELAMAMLFGGFAKRFFEAYHSVYPMKEDAEKRIAIYQLYPLLNHALMFGGNYTAQANRQIQSIQSDIL